MSELFGRNVQVTVGDDSEAIKIGNDFKIAFNVQKLVSAKSSEGSVTIFNLSDENKESIRDKGKRVRIFAGYGNEISLLHDGDVLHVFQIDEEQDKKTVLHFGGNVINTTSANITVSYQNQISIKQIISDALPSFNLSFNKNIVDKLPDASLPTFSFHGKTADLMSKILEPINFQWFENNAEILLSKKNAEIEDDDRQDAFILNHNTGLIKTASQTDRGVNATCLLNPKLVIGSIVKIESDVVSNSAYNEYNTQKPSKNTDGYYKIIQATYQGDNWDGNFEALLQCVPVGADGVNVAGE